MACTKLKHASEAEAQAHLEHLVGLKDSHPARAKRLAVYICRQCQSYHVGHVTPPWRRRGKYKWKGLSV